MTLAARILATFSAVRSCLLVNATVADGDSRTTIVDGSCGNADATAAAGAAGAPLAAGDIVLALFLLVATSFSIGIFAAAFVCGRVTGELPLHRRSSGDGRRRSAGVRGAPFLGIGRGYDMVPVKAPSASGVLLCVLSKIIASRAVGHIIRRHLINKNKPDEMRELASQAEEEGIPIVFYPMWRQRQQQQKEKINDASQDAAADMKSILRDGLPPSYGGSIPGGGDEGRVGVMDYHAAYRSKKVTPSTMMERIFQAMDRLEVQRPNSTTFVQCHRGDVVEQARRSDERWAEGKPLSVFDGVPVAVKDMISVKGYQCSHGTPLRDSDPVATSDDLMVKRFRDAGAIILGTTVMTEFGRCPLGYNSHFQGPCNPYDERHYSGGSSSGSAVAVMLGLVPVAISFDGGGSIRLPAAFSGAVGLAPTYGRIPSNCGMCLSSGNIHAGVITATTTDTALAYALLSPNETGHYYTIQYDGGITGPPSPSLAGFDRIRNLSGIRIGIFRDYFDSADEEVRDCCHKALMQFEECGVEIVEVNIPHLRVLALAHAFSISMDFASSRDAEYYARGGDFEPATMIQLGLGKSMSGVEYLAANRMRGWAIHYFKHIFQQKIDVFITPTSPTTAPRLPLEALRWGESNTTLVTKVMRFIFLVNLAGYPGISEPVGYSRKGHGNLPISLHMMADHWNDALFLRLSHFVEKNILKWQKPKHFVKLSLS